VADDIRVSITGDADDLVRAIAEADAALGTLGHEIDSQKRKMVEFDATSAIMGRNWSNRTSRTIQDLENWKRATNENGDAIGALDSKLNEFGMTFDKTGNIVAQGTSSGGVWNTWLALLTASPLVIIGVVAAVVLLTNVLGTLIAIVADFTGPLVVLVALLGGLGGAIALAAYTAKSSGLKEFTPFRQALADISGEIHKVGLALARDFMPYFLKAASMVRDALQYFNQLAHMNLSQAFHSLSTTGVQGAQQAIEQIAHWFARPIRLAFQFAFSQGAGEQAAANLFHQLTGYLFGKTIQLRNVKFDFAHGAPGGVSHQVDGIFQPFIDWFNRHDFSKQGQKIGAQIRQGLIGSGAAKEMGTFLEQALIQAGKISAQGFWQAWSALFAKTHQLTMEGANWLLSQFTKAAMGAAYAIKSNIDAAWGVIRTLAEGVIGAIKSAWNKLVIAVESVMNVSINWPSPPGWLMSIIHGVGNIVGGGTPTGTGRTSGFHPSAVVTPSVSGGPSAIVVVNVQGSLIHQSALEDAVMKAFQNSVRRGNGPRLATGAVLR
jgi:hypothetical protein